MSWYIWCSCTALLWRFYVWTTCKLCMSMNIIPVIAMVYLMFLVNLIPVIVMVCFMVMKSNIVVFTHIWTPCELCRVSWGHMPIVHQSRAWCICRAILWSLHIYYIWTPCELCMLMKVILVIVMVYLMVLQPWHIRTTCNSILVPLGEPALSSTRQWHAGVFLSFGTVALISILYEVLNLLQTLLNWILIIKWYIKIIFFFLKSIC